MLTVSRRGLFALGGTSAAVLAGCGGEDDPRADASDPELLDAALEAEAALGSTYDSLSGPQFSGDGAQVVSSCKAASTKRQQELTKLGASQPTGGGPTGGGSTLDAITASANPAIAAYRQGARLLATTDLRATNAGFLAQVAAELATIRGLFGDDQVPARSSPGPPGSRSWPRPPRRHPRRRPHRPLRPARTPSERRRPQPPRRAPPRALAAGALAAAGTLRPALALAQSTNDDDLRDFLVHAIGLEQIAVLAYSTAADANGVEAKLKSTLNRFRDQEQAHASACARRSTRSASTRRTRPTRPRTPASSTASTDSTTTTASDLKDLLRAGRR